MTERGDSEPGAGQPSDVGGGHRGGHQQEAGATALVRRGRWAGLPPHAGMRIISPGFKTNFF